MYIENEIILQEDEIHDVYDNQILNTVIDTEKWEFK